MLAYQIGAVFLLVALLMYGTVGGFTPQFLRNSRYLPALIIVGLIGFGFYQAWPSLMSWIGSLSSSPAPQPTAAGPTPAPPVRRAAPAQLKAPEVHWKTTVIDDTVPKVIDPPSTLAPESGPDPDSDLEPAKPSEGKAKHAAKAVGRFFHVIPKRK